RCRRPRHCARSVRACRGRDRRSCGLRAGPAYSVSAPTLCIRCAHPVLASAGRGVGPGTMIRTVLFDAAGTLFDVAEPVGETYARFARREGVSAEPRALDDAFRAAFAGSPPLAFPHARTAELPSLERAWWKRLVFEAFSRARVDAPPAALGR